MDDPNIDVVSFESRVVSLYDNGVVKINLEKRPAVIYRGYYAPVYRLFVDETEEGEWVAEIGTFTIQKDTILNYVKIIEGKTNVYLRECDPPDPADEGEHYAEIQIT